MQYIHEFNLTISEYDKKGEDNIFPHFNSCPICKAQIPLKEHGFYQRNAITSRKAYRISIRRYICPSCHKTLSILPSFLLPYYQYSLSIILEYLWQFIKTKKKRIPFYRQLLEFYKNRFFKNISSMISFFRDTDREIVFEPDKYKKAIKLLEMICTFPKATFSRRYFNQLQKSFMAL